MFLNLKKLALIILFLPVAITFVPFAILFHFASCVFHWLEGHGSKAIVWRFFGVTAIDTYAELYDDENDV